eukprot:scaffold49419_cov64-Attheya_sp.AAC.2
MQNWGQGASGGVDCLSARGWKFGVRGVMEVVFSRYSEEEILRCGQKWCLRNAGEDGSGGMGVTMVGSGSGGNRGGGGISGGGVEGCKRGIIVQSIAVTRCGDGCRRPA